MSTPDILALLPAALVASFFMGLVFRWIVYGLRYLKRLFAF